MPGACWRRCGAIINSVPPDDGVWPSPPPGLKLSRAEIHVWSFPLHRPAPLVAALAELLAPDEHTRANRFRFDRDRRRFIVAHGTLRQILSRYAPAAPEQLQFRYNSHGKPQLTEACGGDKVQFNLSHSHERGVCAVAHDQELGVDLEWIRSLEDLDQIARRFFSANEYKQIRAIEEKHRLEAFYNCWTRKEAYVKACGDGLARPLDRFDVALLPGEPARFLAIEQSALEAKQWFLQSLAPAPGYVGAVALRGGHWRVECWRWPEDD